jgi:molybdopterin-guanine dinucleotide biosynthesis adapter protein
MTAPLFGIAGWKNSGKTTLTERLVAELTARGWRVSTVKHAHHGFDIDQHGTDSFRHRVAGAGEVAIVSSRRWALMHELRDEGEPRLAEIVGRLAPCDVVLVEGFKRDAHPKIEVRRTDARDTAPLGPEIPNVVAIAADHPVDGGGLPVFDIEAVSAMADLVVAACNLPVKDR